MHIRDTWNWIQISGLATMKAPYKRVTYCLARISSNNVSVVRELSDDREL